jgi:radical SAM protein with 4Fe4S-binding SPASM domain
MNCYGAEGFRLGRFFPKLEIDEEAIKMWSSRDVSSLAACSGCRLAFLCGGGCARQVINRGGNLATDSVCPPLAGTAQLQTLIDYYLPRIAAKRHRALCGAEHGTTWMPL